MNDFREYSAAFHAQNDDILHYGVPGMKWRHHRRSLKEWLYGGTSKQIAENARRRSQDARIDYAREVGLREGTNVLRRSDNGIAFLNGEYKDQAKRMDNLIKRDNKSKHRTSLSGEYGPSLDKLDAIYRRESAKAKQASNESVVGKAKRNFGALKDTVKSISLKDYTDFYGNLFKKKKKKK